jgi:cell division protein FtsI/penicillin-binding protein 2
VTARSRERGSHAGRPRGSGLSFPNLALPGFSSRAGGRAAAKPGPKTSARASAPADIPLQQPEATLAPAAPPVPDAAPTAAPVGAMNPGAATVPAPPAAPAPGGPPAGGGHGHGSRHRKGSDQHPLRSRKVRLAAALVIIAGLFAAGFANGFGSEASAEPTVQAFLLDWQQGHYDQAAALTNGPAGTVRPSLASAYTDLDATNAFLAMDRLTQHGDTAVATYKATIDLAQAGQTWTYRGQFGLTASGGHWVVNWAPSIVNPHVGAGDRLAVVTTFAPRAQIEDAAGHPLLAESKTYRVGVYPGRLKSQAVTAAEFSKIAGVNPQQVLGQIKAAPPKSFISLLTLDPAAFTTLAPQLSKVPGIVAKQQQQRLFDSAASEVVGDVGTENSDTLRAAGATYQPGMTVGVDGLESAYQDDLVGTPTTSVVVVDSAGRRVQTLWSSLDGHPGKPVKTTLDAKVQENAVSALDGQASSAEIVAVDTATGAVRALASREADGGLALPDGGVLNGKVEPGMSFSIVSAAAMLNAGISANHPLPCEQVADVGGVTFTYQPAASPTATLASDFASGCGTAFANMSTTLTPQQLIAAEHSFGVGAPWKLPLQAFSGTAPVVSDEAGVAAQATGSGGVLMSPLGMATVAAAVADGAGHTPVLLDGATSATTASPLPASALDSLRSLMRLSVTKGAAHAANLSGQPVYGQAGVVKTASNAYLSWFVGYRGSLAVAVLETGKTADQAAAGLAGTFLKSAG